VTLFSVIAMAAVGGALYTICTSSVAVPLLPVTVQRRI
jgi:hypothetical protein